jgi:hypothetical protein
LTLFSVSGARGLALSAAAGGVVVILGWRRVAVATSIPIAIVIGGLTGWVATTDLPITVAYAGWLGLLMLASTRAGVTRTVVANVAILLAALGAVEGVATWLGRANDTVAPEPYRESSYWGEDFRAERKEFSDRVETGSGTVERTIAGRIIRMNADYAGRYITVKDGRRSTTGAPESGPRILLFGGSTMLDAEVPDEYTIASRLQALVGDAWRVENYGVSGASLAANVAWLKVLDLDRRDLVVTFSGVNNVGGVVDRGARWPTLYEMLDAPRFEAARRRSWLVARLHTLANVPVYERDDAAVESAVSRYAGDLDAAAALAEQRGVRYLNFLQPHLWTTDSSALSEGEAALTRSWGPTFREVVIEAYGQMEAAVSQRQDTVDLTGLFDTKQRSIFFDWHHVNEHGNELLAGAIHAELERRGWLSDE